MYRSIEQIHPGRTFQPWLSIHLVLWTKHLEAAALVQPSPGPQEVIFDSSPAEQRCGSSCFVHKLTHWIQEIHHTAGKQQPPREGWWFRSDTCYSGNWNPGWVWAGHDAAVFKTLVKRQSWTRDNHGPLEVRLARLAPKCPIYTVFWCLLDLFFWRCIGMIGIQNLSQGDGAVKLLSSYATTDLRGSQFGSTCISSNTVPAVWHGRSWQYFQGEDTADLLSTWFQFSSLSAQRNKTTSKWEVNCAANTQTLDGLCILCPQSQVGNRLNSSWNHYWDSRYCISPNQEKIIVAISFREALVSESQL